MANTTSDKAKSATKLVIPCRFSYAHVFVPSAIEEGQTKKYSVSCIIPKKEKELIKKIKEVIALAAEEGKAKAFGGKVPSVYKNPLRDGDEERPDDPAYANSYFINANSTTKPQVVDGKLQAIIDPAEFYSGCYGKASINFYAFNKAGNKGVAAGLGNVQKLKDGDPLTGRTTAEQDFEVEETDDDDDL